MRKHTSYTKCISYRRYFTRRKANFIEKSTSEEVLFSWRLKQDSNL